jgi:hypothetical protein
MVTPASKAPRRRRVFLLLLLVLLFLLGGTYIWLHLDDSPITLANYDRIQIGMALDEAVKFLGEPGETRPVYPNGEQPYKFAIWITKDGKTTLSLIVDVDGTVLSKHYHSDALVNKLLRTIGVKPRPEGEISVKGTPKGG